MSKASDHWTTWHEQTLPAGPFVVRVNRTQRPTRTALDIPDLPNVIYIQQGGKYCGSLDRETAVRFQVQDMNPDGSQWLRPDGLYSVWAPHVGKPLPSSNDEGTKATWDFGDGGTVTFLYDLPRPAPAPVYSVVWEAVHAFRTVSGRRDTVYASLSARGPAGRYGPANWGPLTLDREGELKDATSIHGILLHKHASAVLDVSWGAVDCRHCNSAEIISALGNAVACACPDYEASPHLDNHPPSEMNKRDEAIALNMPSHDCITPILRGHFRANGIDLYNETSKAGGWIIHREYDHIPSSRGRGYYDATIRIIRTQG